MQWSLVWCVINPLITKKVNENISTRPHEVSTCSHRSTLRRQRFAIRDEQKAKSNYHLLSIYNFAEIYVVCEHVATSNNCEISLYASAKFVCELSFIKCIIRRFLRKKNFVKFATHDAFWCLHRKKSSRVLKTTRNHKPTTRRQMTSRGVFYAGKIVYLSHEGKLPRWLFFLSIHELRSRSKLSDGNSQ